MGEVYKMTIAGCERELPICPISDTLDIAGFVMFGDVEITEKAAKALMEKCPEHDIITSRRSLRAFRWLTRWRASAAVSTLLHVRASRRT